MSERRTAIGFWGGGIVVVVLLAVLLAGGTNEEPLDPRSVAPDGAKALVDLLESFGAEVELGRALPTADHTTALLLSDSYGLADREAVESWVRGGGILVVADPSSALTPRLGAPTGTSGCAAPALEAVRELVAVDETYRAPADAQSCFDGGVVVDPVGGGVVVSVGGPRPFLNASLGAGDNAVLAVAVLAPTSATTVAFLEPALPVGGSGESLVDLIADPVWLLVIQAGVGFVLFGWWRSRRLGRPVPEPIEVRIEGSELAAARGRLLEGIRQPGAAAAEIRADTRRRLARRLGLPLDAAVDVVAARAAATAAVDRAEVEALLDDHPIATDAELVTLGRGLAAIRRAVFDPSPSAAPTGPAGSPASSIETTVSGAS